MKNFWKQSKKVSMTMKKIKISLYFDIHSWLRTYFPHYIKLNFVSEIMVRMNSLADALKCMNNAVKRGKRQVLLRPCSKVVLRFLTVMMKHGYIGEFEVRIIFILIALWYLPYGELLYWFRDGCHIIYFDDGNIVGVCLIIYQTLGNSHLQRAFVIENFL